MGTPSELSAFSCGERDRVNGNSWANPYQEDDILYAYYNDGFNGAIFRPSSGW